jgi:hypothetical protein
LLEHDPHEYASGFEYGTITWAEGVFQVAIDPSILILTVLAVVQVVPLWFMSMNGWWMLRG